MLTPTILSYANELLGNPKEKESLWYDCQAALQGYGYLIHIYRGLVTNTRILQLKWGRVDGKLTRRYST